jgi:hypothetical protein
VPAVRITDGWGPSRGEHRHSRNGGVPLVRRTGSKGDRATEKALEVPLGKFAVSVWPKVRIFAILMRCWRPCWAVTRWSAPVLAESLDACDADGEVGMVSH